MHSAFCNRTDLDSFLSDACVFCIAVEEGERIGFVERDSCTAYHLKLGGF